MITGKVILTNQSIPATDFKITATGPYGSRSTFTDGTGAFIFRGVGNGTYYLDYSKEGYGSIRQYNIRVFGGDTVIVQDVILFEKPGDFKMPELVKAYIKEEPYGPTVLIETRKENYYEYPVIFFMDVNPEVSWKTSTFSVVPWVNMLYTNPPVLSFQIQIYDFPFESGTKVYTRAYPCNTQEWNYTGYIDIYQGIEVLATLDKSRPSNVVSFVMP